MFEIGRSIVDMGVFGRAAGHRTDPNGCHRHSRSSVRRRSVLRSGLPPVTTATRFTRPLSKSNMRVPGVSTKGSPSCRTLGRLLLAVPAADEIEAVRLATSWLRRPIWSACRSRKDHSTSALPLSVRLPSALERCGHDARSGISMLAAPVAVAALGRIGRQAVANAPRRCRDVLPTLRRADVTSALPPGEREQAGH